MHLVKMLVTNIEHQRFVRARGVPAPGATRSHAQAVTAANDKKGALQVRCTVWRCMQHIIKQHRAMSQLPVLALSIHLCCAVGFIVV